MQRGGPQLAIGSICEYLDDPRLNWVVLPSTALMVADTLRFILEYRHGKVIVTMFQTRIREEQKRGR